MINLSDGVSEREAIAMAEDYALQTGREKYWRIAEPKVTSSDDGLWWIVDFRPIEDGWGSGGRDPKQLTFQQLLPFKVRINKSSGQLSFTKFVTDKGKLIVFDEKTDYRPR